MSTLSLAARAEFAAVEGRPLFHAGWRRTVFIHYEVDPAALQPQVPFPLDTRDGKAYVSLVAFTLADLRFAAGGPSFSTHGFLNVRTYIPGNGIYFLAEWLPNPFCVFLGPRLYGLPYRRGKLTYDHVHERGALHGKVEAPEGVLEFRAPVDPAARYAPLRARHDRRVPPRTLHRLHPVRSRRAPLPGLAPTLAAGPGRPHGARGEPRGVDRTLVPRSAPARGELLARIRRGLDGTAPKEGRMTALRITGGLQPAVAAEIFTALFSTDAAAAVGGLR